MTMLRVSQLGVDPAYQRTVKRPVVRKIVRNFSPTAFGSLIVGKRQDGSLWVVDGQQRLAAIKILEHEFVEANIFDSRGPQHEAEVFRQINGDRQNVTRNELFKAQVEAGDIQSVDILAVVERCGFTLCFRGGSNSPPHQIRQAAPLEMLYEWGGSTLLAKVLTTIHDVWQDTRGATRSFVLTGIGRFYRTYPDADSKRVAKCLRQLSPDQLLRYADNERQLLGGLRDQVVVKVIVAQYNKRLSPKNTLRGDTNGVQRSGGTDS